VSRIRRYRVAHLVFLNNRTCVVDLSRFNRDRTNEGWAARVSIPTPWESLQLVIEIVGSSRPPHYPLE
jgi:hypothetical protein